MCYGFIHGRENKTVEVISLGPKMLTHIYVAAWYTVLKMSKLFKNSQLIFKILIHVHISHTIVFILSSVWALPLFLWHWLQFGHQEGGGPLHGLLPGWGSWEVCGLFPEIPTFYPCDPQVIPLVYSGLQVHIWRKACGSANSGQQASVKGKYKVIVKHWLSTGGICALVNVLPWLETFLFVRTRVPGGVRRGTTDVEWLEVGLLLKSYCAQNKPPSTTKDYPAPNVSSAEAEKPLLRWSQKIIPWLLGASHLPSRIKCCQVFMWPTTFYNIGGVTVQTVDLEGSWEYRRPFSLSRLSLSSLSEHLE